VRDIDANLVCLECKLSKLAEVSKGREALCGGKGAEAP